MPQEFVNLLLCILSLNVGSVPHFAEWLHKVLSQSIGFRVLWADNYGLDASPFHVHLVFVIGAATEWWSSVSFDRNRKPVCREDAVNVLDDSLGTGALGELYFWVSGIFIDHHKQLFSVG